MNSGNINHRDKAALDWFKRIFGKKLMVKPGDIGVYHYIWSCDTLHEDSHGLKYDIYAKIRAVEVYEELVEIDLIDIKINDSASTDIQNIVKNNFPKYVNPRYVKWQLKQQ